MRMNGLFSMARRLGLAIAIVVSSVGVAAARAARATTVILVRHAEKAAEPADDPPLTPRVKRVRTICWNAVKDAGVSAVITTQFARTRATAQPTSTAAHFRPRSSAPAVDACAGRRRGGAQARRAHGVRRRTLEHRSGDRRSVGRKAPAADLRRGVRQSVHRHDRAGRKAGVMRSKFGARTPVDANCATTIAPTWRSSPAATSDDRRDHGRQRVHRPQHLVRRFADRRAGRCGSFVAISSRAPRALLRRRGRRRPRGRSDSRADARAALESNVDAHRTRDRRCDAVGRRAHRLHLVTGGGWSGASRRPPSAEETRRRADRSVRPKQARGGTTPRRREDVPFVIVRPAAVYGPNDRDFLAMFRLARRGVAPCTGNRDQWISIVQVDDLARGVVLASSQRRCGRHTYFIANDEPIQWRDLFRLRRGAPGAPLQVDVEVPAALVRVGAAARRRRRSRVAARRAADEREGRASRAALLDLLERAKSSASSASATISADGRSRRHLSLVRRQRVAVIRRAAGCRRSSSLAFAAVPCARRRRRPFHRPRASIATSSDSARWDCIDTLLSARGRSANARSCAARPRHSATSIGTPPRREWAKRDIRADLARYGVHGNRRSTKCQAEAVGWTVRIAGAGRRERDDRRGDQSARGKSRWSPDRERRDVSLETMHTAMLGPHVAVSIPRGCRRSIRAADTRRRSSRCSRARSMRCSPGLSIEVGRDYAAFGQSPTGGLLLSPNCAGAGHGSRCRTIAHGPCRSSRGCSDRCAARCSSADLGTRQLHPHAKLVAYHLAALPHPHFELGVQVVDAMGGNGGQPASFGDRVLDAIPIVERIRTVGFPVLEQAGRHRPAMADAALARLRAVRRGRHRRFRRSA